MRRFLPLAVIAMLCLMGCVEGLAQSQEKTAMSQAAVQRVRVVCVGDSITDGNTYPLILMQALADADKPVPAAVCAGVASDTAALMAARFDPFLEMKPDIVTFSAGTNDASRGVAPADYEKALREIAEKCKANKITMILLTPCAINVGDTNKPNEKAEAIGEEYAEIIRTVAKEYGWPVAEVSALQKAARKKGETIMSPDGIHPDYHGQSLMARAILDAMGHKDVPVPTAKEFKPQPLPGMATLWFVQAAPTEKKNDKDVPRQWSDDELAEQTRMLTALFGGGDINGRIAWHSYTFPEKQKANKDGKFVDAGDWKEQLRRNGFAIHINDLVEGRLRYWGTVVPSDGAKKAFVNTALGAQRVWLNGKLIYTHPKDSGGNEIWTGYHAGKERIAVTLAKGPNTLVIEHNNNEFFMSVTDKLVWEEDYAAELEKAAKKK
ncbi:MAG: GDSL-type esterase/lipase family protein [Phycisphaerae bacterium]|nr:GDSL-type esterase/lipase family protein [Phycisphaerae bacterium]